MSATISDIYTCTPRQIAELVEDILYDGLVPYVKSSPGMGKSEIIRGIFKRLVLYPIDHRASTSDPTDFNGLPGFDNGKAKFMPFEEIFPIQSTPVPDGYHGFGIFLDEFNSAPKSIQAASYKLALDKMVGQHKLHEHTAIAMAGNLDSDGAITTRMSTAMKSRIITLKMRTDFKEWLEDVAIPRDYDHRIIAYLNWKKDALNDFDPLKSEDSFCCQRTWHFMNEQIKDRPVLDNKLPKYVGTITPGVAVDFVQFTKVYASIPDIRTIVNNPHSAVVPQDTATRWAVTMKLASEVDDSNFNAVGTYIDRFQIENRILFYRTAVAKNPTLHTHPDFIKAMVTMSHYLHGTDRQLGGFAKAA